MGGPETGNVFSGSIPTLYETYLVPLIPAIAYCQGTPLRNEIEARDPLGLGEATDIAADAITQRFGREAVDGKIQAHIVTVEG